MIALAQLVATIERDYGLQLVAPPEALAPGVHSVAWRVTTDDGQWIAKVSHAASDTPDVLGAQARLMAFVREQGMHAPLILPLLNGAFIGMVVDERRAYPLQVMRSERLRRTSWASITRHEIVAIGGLAAQLHRVFARYPERHRFVDNVVKSANEWGQQRIGLWEALQEANYAAAFTTEDQEWIRRVDQQMLAYIESHYPDPSTLACALLHGDLSIDHVRFLPDDTPYVFDFGDASWGPVAHELAVCLLGSFGTTDLTIDEWHDLGADFLAGYMSQSPLAAQDLAAVPLFIVNRILAQARYIVELTANVQDLNTPVIRRTYGLAEHLLGSHA